MGDQRFLDLPLGDGTSNFHSFQCTHTSTVPVIVIFTKYDLLVAKLEKEAILTEEEEEDEAAFERRIEKQAEEMAQQMCVEPLKRITRDRQIPSMMVSSERHFLWVSHRTNNGSSKSNLPQHSGRSHPSHARPY